MAPNPDPASVAALEHPPVEGVPDAARATTGESVARGGTWQVAARVLPQFYLLAVSVIAARYLGPEGMGRQSFIAFVALSATTLLSSGLSLSLMRHIGEAIGAGRLGAVRDLVRWAWRVQSGAALVGGGALGAIGLFGAVPLAAWVLAGTACGLGILHSVPSSVLIGTQRWRETSVVTLTTGTIGVLATIAVLTAGGGIVGMFAVEAVILSLNVTATTFLAGRAVRAMPVAPERAPDLRAATARFAAWSTLAVLLTLIVFRRSEFFFLERYGSDTDIALYSIAFAVVAGLILLPETLGGLISPAFATLYGAGEMHRVSRGYGRVMRLLIIVAFVLTAGAAAFGPAGLRILYGEQYRETGPVLLLLVAVLPIVPLQYVANGLLVGLGRIRVPLVTAGFAAAVTVTLNLLLVPPFAAVGAAIANAGGQVAATVPMVVYASRLVGSVDWRSWTLARAGLAAAAAGSVGVAVVASLGDVAGVLAGLPLSAAVFAVLARLLKIVPGDDARWVDGAVGARLGGLVGKAFRLIAPA